VSELAVPLPLLDRVAAHGYALAYDAVVDGFEPYERLVDEVAALVARSSGGPARVLDASCGTGSVARRLAARGHDVLAVDPVAELVETARHRDRSGIGGRVSYRHLDLARTPLDEDDRVDVVVSMHTLSWHPDPMAMLVGCRRALRPGGHAIVLSYARPAHVATTFGALRARAGFGDAVRALRWLVPTAAFEMLRQYEQRLLDVQALQIMMSEAGFEVRESRPTFLAGVSALAWARLSISAKESEVSRRVEIG
jgi:ubiquinone/menaquinone biosynthesis C-methylase UbiE